MCQTDVQHKFPRHYPPKSVHGCEISRRRRNELSLTSSASIPIGFLPIITNGHTTRIRACEMLNNTFYVEMHSVGVLKTSPPHILPLKLPRITIEYNMYVRTYTKYTSRSRVYVYDDYFEPWAMIIYYNCKLRVQHNKEYYKLII